MTLNFEDAVFGKETEIEIPREENVIHVMELVLKKEQSQKHVHIVMELVN